MAEPLHFCLGSALQYAALGPFFLIGQVANVVLDVCDADTQYQTTTARQEEREASLRREAELARKMKAAHEASKKASQERERQLAELVLKLAEELKKRG